jgi:transcriptional regulator with XRE-family HTH domain
MLSASQIRAARALLGWSGKDLASISGVGITTIRRYELQEGIPAGSTSVLATLKSVLESAGIIFTGDPLSNPGVTLEMSRRGDSDE